MGMAVENMGVYAAIYVVRRRAKCCTKSADAFPILPDALAARSRSGERGDRRRIGLNARGECETAAMPMNRPQISSR